MMEDGRCRMEVKSKKYLIEDRRCEIEDEG
jgi:hypothetical protein